MDTWRLGRRPALDGLRGIAVLMVIAAHFGIVGLNSTSAGTAGVTAFFTLSGFLITALLLQERSARGTISRRAFYRRRALRLVPALTVCIVLAVTLELVITRRVADWDMIVGTLTYTSDFVMADGHWTQTTFLGHTWSLAIEEQFYLLWPFALMALMRLGRTRAIIVLLYASGAAVVLRHLMWNGGEGKIRLWMGPDTRSDAILIGCLLAVVLHGSEVRAVSRWWIIGGGIALATTLPWFFNTSAESVAVTTPLLVALGTAAVIYGVANRPAGTVLGSALLRWIGVRSYGLYLYHVPIAIAVHHWFGLGMISTWMTAGPLAFVAAAVSYRYVEAPFLRRRQLADKDRAPAATVIVAAVTDAESAPPMPYVPAVAAEKVPK